MNLYRDLAIRILEDYKESRRQELGRSPVSALRRLGLRVKVFESSIYQTSDCSCDGVFLDDLNAIGYRPTPGSRRERFTLLHEFGHYAIRSNIDVLSELHDIDDDGGQQAEERVCDSLAGLLLIPDTRLDAVLNGSRPLAGHVAELHKESYGSMEACAVRLSERLPSFGYVMIANPKSKTVRFASASPTTPYRLRRGTVLRDSHPIWRAKSVGRHRGQGSITWPSGQTRTLWFDAASYEHEVHAVFTESRYWPGSGLSVLDGGTRPARKAAYSGTCPHCSSHTWGYSLHDACGELWCRSCKKCACGTPSKREPETKTCIQCGLSKRTNLFPDDGTRCVDCP